MSPHLNQSSSPHIHHRCSAVPCPEPMQLIANRVPCWRHPYSPPTSPNDQFLMCWGGFWSICHQPCLVAIHDISSLILKWFLIVNDHRKVAATGFPLPQPRFCLIHNQVMISQWISYQTTLELQKRMTFFWLITWLLVLMAWSFGEGPSERSKLRVETPTELSAHYSFDRNKFKKYFCKRVIVNQNVEDLESQLGAFQDLVQIQSWEIAFIYALVKKIVLLQFEEFYYTLAKVNDGYYKAKVNKLEHATFHYSWVYRMMETRHFTMCNWNTLWSSLSREITWMKSWLIQELSSQTLWRSRISPKWHLCFGK